MARIVPQSRWQNASPNEGRSCLLELLRVQLERQFAVPAFQRDDIAVLLELNAFRQLNRFFCSCFCLLISEAPACGNDAENLTTNTFFTRLAIAHHAADVRPAPSHPAPSANRPCRGIPAGPAACALDLLNHGHTVKILELNGERLRGALPTVSRNQDVAFVLQIVFAMASFAFEAGIETATLAPLLANACQHICDRVGHTHVLSPPTSWLSSGRGFAFHGCFTQLVTTEAETCGTHHGADPRTAVTLARFGLPSRGSLFNFACATPRSSELLMLRIIAFSALRFSLLRDELGTLEFTRNH